MQRKRIYIYGAGKRGHELLNLINSSYCDGLYVRGFIDKSKYGYLDNTRILRLNECTDDIPIVISIGDFEVALDVAITLKNKGYKKIYWYNSKTIRKEYKNFFLEQCVSCDNWNNATLLHVEMHAMDACNLNCRGCTHYAPIFDKKKPDTQSRLTDIEMLGNKIKSIVNFYILGGEPLLNDEVQNYLEKVKEIYKDAAVILVTNGLMLPKCSADLLNYFSDNNICISISEYEPTHRMIDKIMEILNKYNIIYTLRQYDTKQRFNLPLTMNKTNERYCISKNCINIWNGKIARCPTLMYVPELNMKFNLNFPEEGIYKLSEFVSDIEIKKELEKNVPLCDFCSKNEIEWQICGQNVSARDFVV